MSETPPEVGNMPGDRRPVPDPTVLTTQQLVREIAALREIIEARLDAMDLATDLRLRAFERIPTDVTTEVTHLASFVDEKFNTVDVRFQGIAQQFLERDIRVETGARAGKEALDAALLAAKELVGTTNEANTIAALKAEQATAKQIDAIGVQIATKSEATDARIDEMKERLDRFEGTVNGAQQFRNTQRLDSGAMVAMIAVIIAFLGIAVAVGLAIALH